MECKTFSFQFLRTFEELCLHANYNTSNSMIISALKKKKNCKSKSKPILKKNLDKVMMPFDNLRISFWFYV